MQRTITKKRKGIILAGGLSSRLLPCTNIVTKQLLPVYDKPLIYYPLSTLMLAGIRDILIISVPNEQDQFRKLLGDGSQFGINISYKVQEKPNGIAEAFLIAEDFIGDHPVALILGDNIFYGNDFSNQLLLAKPDGATVFAYHVADPQRFGVLKVNTFGQIEDIIEKPSDPPSNWAVTGLYFYDENVVYYTKMIKPSTRGELEITDLNRLYLRDSVINVKYLKRGIAWFDTGTFDSLLTASTFVGTVQKNTGTMISCPEEISFRQNWITSIELEKAASQYGKSDYGKYLTKLHTEWVFEGYSAY